MGKYLKDPFVHFVALGLLLFLGHGIWQSSVSKSAATIIIDAPVKARLSAVFEAEQGRPPTASELEAVASGYITEQALAREAIRAGLGEGDTIITRRLAQKMRFMLESNTLPDDPGDAVLKPWFNARADDFALPPARALSHIYLSGSADSAAMAARIAAITSALENGESPIGLGDPFMLQSRYGLLDRPAMTRIFGAAFTDAAMALPATPGLWQGPVESAFGLHFVRFDEVRNGRSAVFDEARGAVLSDWQNAQLDKDNAARLRAVIDNYAVQTQ